MSDPSSQIALRRRTRTSLGAWLSRYTSISDHAGSKLSRSKPRERESVIGASPSTRSPSARSAWKAPRRFGGAGRRFPRGLPAVGGTLLQAAHHELVEIGRYRRPSPRERLGLARPMEGRELDGPRRHEGARPQSLVGEGAEGVDVGAVVGPRVARRLLGSHVRRAPDDDSRRRDRLRAGGVARDAGDPEVRDLCVPRERSAFSGLTSRWTTPSPCA